MLTIDSSAIVLDHLTRTLQSNYYHHIIKILFFFNTMQIKVASVFALAVSVFAAPGDIPYSFATKQLNTIAEVTSSFNDAITGWNGQYLQGLPVLAQGANLAKIITSAVTPPKSGGDEDADEAQKEAFVAAEKLADEVKNTVNTAIDAKPKLASVPILGTQTGLRLFQNLLAAAQTLGKAYTANATPDMQKKSQKITDAIVAELQRGVKAYS